MKRENLIIESIDSVSVLDSATGELLLLLDQPKDGTLENANDTVYMTGKQGMQLAALDRNKTSKFSCNNAYVVAGALAAQLGTAVEEASESNKIRVPELERIALSDPTTATLTHIPVGVSGAEVPFVWKVNKDGSQGAKLAVDAAAAVGKFKVDASTKKLTFAADEFKAGDEIYVAYTYEMTEGMKIANKADSFGITGRMVIDVLMRDVCEQSHKYHGKVEYPVAKIDGNFSLAFGDEPAVHAFSAQAMTNVCSKDKTLFNWYVCE